MLDIKLKDGTITKDLRLDRIEFFDEKSREFPVIRSFIAREQISKQWICPRTLDQGAEGACVGFGIAHELLSEPVMASTTIVNNQYARKSIYWPAQKIDQRPGGSYPGARPFYEGTSVIAGIKVIQRLGWITDYEWAFSLNELILGIGYKGPAVLGLPIYDTMLDTDKNGYISPKNGQLVGGHCILARGVNIPKKRFILRNSWGPFWGMGGDCFVSFDDMDFLLHQRGEAAFFTGRKLLGKKK